MGIYGRKDLREVCARVFVGPCGRAELERRNSGNI